MFDSGDGVMDLGPFSCDRYVLKQEQYLVKTKISKIRLRTKTDDCFEFQTQIGTDIYFE